MGNETRLLERVVNSNMPTKFYLVRWDIILHNCSSIKDYVMVVNLLYFM